MKIIFLHIPKTGGTTFHNILEKIYAREEVYTINIVDQKLRTDQFVNLSSHRKSKIKVLKGHMEFGLHCEFDYSPVKYITFLRHPVDRIISHYLHVKRNPQNKYHEIVSKNNMSLLDYALSDLLPELDNGQTRLISGMKAIEINNCTEQMLDKAIENIKLHFLFAGVKEQYNEGLILLKKILNWEHYPFYKSLNVRQNREEIDVNIRRQIAERNHYDVRLYNWVHERFTEEVNSIDNLEFELATLRAANYAYHTGLESSNQNMIQTKTLKKVKKWLKKSTILFSIKK